MTKRPADRATPGRRLNNRARAWWFFVAFAALAAAVVLAGFSRSFFVPVARGSFAAPRTVYVHAAFFLSWVSLLIAQTSLATLRKIAWHRRLGWCAAFLVPGMAVSGTAVSLWATSRDVRAGQGDTALSFFFGLMLDVVSFSMLASAGLLMRRRPDVHKRLLVMATLAVLGAALGRIPAIGKMADLVTLGLFLSVVAYDMATRRRIHLATVGGGLVLAGQTALAPLGSTQAWLSVARRIIAQGYY